ncbi:MAG: tetratricopeptide repeat protein [Planctomycetes bacterium]|jgi:tetratricopeptide (TPR) repeat protein|nr:tetratricopeptide repeat protein [Planctomycetota bacterium]MCL4729136.1 tetratricopeptide repeat protein [Planctomycetota bacterium]
MHAETAYVFRHVLIRDGAYGLHLPAERARLHGLALDLLEALLADLGDESLRDACAAEMAEHARLGRGPVLDPALLERESAHLARAGAWADRQYRHDDARALWQRLAELPGIEATQRARALYRLGVLERSYGSLDRAEVFLNQGLEVCPPEQWLHRAALANALTQVCMSRHDLNRAAHVAALAMDSARRCGDANELAVAHFNAARIALDRGELEPAAAQLEQAIQFQRRSVAPGQASVPMGNLAYLRARQGRHDQALALAEESVRLARQTGRAHVVSRALLGRAVIHTLAPRLDLAEADYREAARIAREIGSYNEAALCHINFSVLLILRRQLEEARGLLLDAIEYMRDAGDAGEDIGRVNLAQVLCLMGDGPGAETHARLALEHTLGTARSGDVPLCALTLAAALMLQGRYAEALELARTHGAPGVPDGIRQGLEAIAGLCSWKISGDTAGRNRVVAVLEVSKANDKIGWVPDVLKVVLERPD